MKTSILEDLGEVLDMGPSMANPLIQGHGLWIAERENTLTLKKADSYKRVLLHLINHPFPS